MFVYMLMKGMLINVGEILRQNMMKFTNYLRWQFYYGGLITQFLWSHDNEEEVVDMNVERHPKLTGMLVDVMRTMALDISNGPVFSASDRHLRDDIFMAHMFEMNELQL